MKIEIVNSSYDLEGYYSETTLLEQLYQLRQKNKEKLFEIDIIEKCGVLCEKSHVGSKVFEVGIHQYTSFADVKIDHGLINDTGMYVYLCPECYEDIKLKLA